MRRPTQAAGMAEALAVSSLWGREVLILIWVESQADYVTVPVGPKVGEPVKVIWNGVNHYDVWRG